MPSWHLLFVWFGLVLMCFELNPYAKMTHLGVACSVTLHIHSFPLSLMTHTERGVAMSSVLHDRAWLVLSVY